MRHQHILIIIALFILSLSSVNAVTYSTDIFSNSSSVTTTSSGLIEPMNKTVNLSNNMTVLFQGRPSGTNPDYAFAITTSSGITSGPTQLFAIQIDDEAGTGSDRIRYCTEPCGNCNTVAQFTQLCTSGCGGNDFSANIYEYKVIIANQVATMYINGSSKGTIATCPNFTYSYYSHRGLGGSPGGAEIHNRKVNATFINQLPTIDTVTISDTTPSIDVNVDVQIQGTDADSDSIMGAVDFKYNGETLINCSDQFTVCYNNTDNVTFTRSYGEFGTYTLLAVVSDSINGGFNNSITSLSYATQVMTVSSQDTLGAQDGIQFNSQIVNPDNIDEGLLPNLYNGTVSFFSSIGVYLIIILVGVVVILIGIALINAAKRF